MKMKSFFTSVALGAMVLSRTTSLSAETKVFTQLDDGTFDHTETILGEIAYQGGHMERGLLTLAAPLDVSALRFEFPASCDATILEAGTVTEGVADVARNIGQNRFSINEGRGMRARSIFVSIDGPASAGCSVLVFKTSAQQNPVPGTEYAYTCLQNTAPGYVPATIYSQNWSVPFRMAPNETVFIRSNLLPGRTAPFTSISFDGDASPAIHFVNVAVAASIATSPNCDLLPMYNFAVSSDQWRLELLRQH